MESEIQLAHFRKIHYIVMTIFLILFFLFTIILGIFGPSEYSLKTQSGFKSVEGDGFQFTLPLLNKNELELKVMYQQKININNNYNMTLYEKKSQAIEVNFIDKDDKINETKIFNFTCTYRKDIICGRVEIIEQKVYRKGKGIISLKLIDNEPQDGIKVLGNLNVFTSTDRYTQINILYSLIVFSISVIIFIVYVIIELRYLQKKGRFNGLQLMNGLLVFAVVGHTFPWNAVAYSIQWIGVFALSKASYSVFNVVFICYLFFMLDSFMKQNGTSSKKVVWITRVLLLSVFVVCRLTNTTLHAVCSVQNVLIPKNTLHSTSIFFDVIEGLLYFFLYSWALYHLAMTYNKVTIPIIQKQLNYFAACTALFLLVLIFLLFFSGIISEETTFATYFENGSMVVYLISMLCAFLPSLSPVKNEWSIFYNEMDDDQPLYDEED
ncbi:hypothetical protein ENU1_095090 [Entamoeba nuttalli P19]|uniref:Wntless-like transmembrane domain-containing protein n=1 Tax=Entamoeba nuttalli (strain P19) TaxID=1076696 RepID=K2GCN5_ENTNP|nr:hypothetical protein ENU1_095090 [Entamoeba nuttalli P19]EKE40306.1 hypothetical protein ENU1_095090 [Entamoeba nuttalli P19]|eukprot:XP_008857355.1 hypothetical protein ENU1_095090 [Entamoeba nuttalli P19]